MAKILQIFVSVLLVVVAVEVSAQTHHVVGGDGGWTPASDITSWLSGRVFRVGDKIWFTNDPATEESIVELQSQEDLESCNLQNPIKMYTDAVKLEEEGIRYFTSGNLDSCKNGLKLPVPVQAHSEFGPSEPFQPTFGPPQPFQPTFGPPPHEPFHPPTPTFGPPPEPFHPPPTSRPPPPKPFHPPPTEPFHPPPTEPFHPPPPKPFHPPPTEPFHPPPTVGPPPPEHFKPPPPVPVHPPPTIKSPPPPEHFKPPPPVPVHPPPTIKSPPPPPPPPSFRPPPPPPPPFGSPPPPPSAPSASNNLNGLSYGLFVGLGFCYMSLHL